MEEREKRRCNVIIHGLVEKCDGSLRERQDHDDGSLQEIVQCLGVGHLVIAKSYRIGKQQMNKARALKVVFRDSFSKFEFLRKSKELRKREKFRETYVSNDLTTHQRHEEYLLRQELRRQRIAGLDVVIHNGHVVPRGSIRNFRQ